MTLNITLVTKQIVVQASDRRMVPFGSGDVDDDATKGLVLKTADGLFGITFAGVGKYGKRVDLWLAEEIADHGVPELPIEEGLAIIARRASAWFEQMPATIPRWHLFVVGGWQVHGQRHDPRLWTVSNYTAEDGWSALAAPRPHFEVREYEMRGGRGLVCAFGIHEALTRAERRRIDAVLRKPVDVDRIQETLVGCIRAAAANPKANGGINGEVLVVAVAPTGECRSTFYPSAAAPWNYSPLLVWNEGGNNFIAGDARISLSRDVVYRVGPHLSVRTLGGQVHAESASSQGEIVGRFRVSEAKFSKPAEGRDMTPIFGIVPVR